MLGETLFLANSQPMTITAVLEDLPPNGTHLDSAIFASGLAAHSQLRTIDANPANAAGSDALSIDVHTYVTLKAGASPSRVESGAPALMREIWPPSGEMATASFELVRLDRINAFLPLNPGFAARLIMAAAIGAVTLLIACVNFINLLTARTARRALEVGIRKVSGAGRSVLIAQFLGESMVYVVVAALIAIMLTEVSLPCVNAFVLSSATFHYWREPALIGWFGLLTAFLGVISGAYPAFVLAALRPVVALKGWLGQSSKTLVFRQALVTLQFIGFGVVELAAFDLYDVTPVAGSLSLDAAGGETAAGRSMRLVLNETAVRRLGYASARAAVGQTIQMPGPNGPIESEIIGVAPDITLESVEREAHPMIYFSVPSLFNLINVRLTGQRVPETLDAIDALWRKTGGNGPLKRYFLDEHIQSLYLSMLRQAQVFGFSSVIAAVLACLGLIALSASTAQRRTREIGLRKAMGATTRDIALLLLWANVIAWMVVAVAMRRWLLGFAYHVDLDLRLFAAATGVAMLFALLTVSSQSLRLAGTKPVMALRYE